MSVHTFEDLIAWQKARSMTDAIYQISNVSGFAKDYGLRDQIRRASVSVMSNIAEGFERNNPNEFHQFLVIAKASCAEVRSQLYVALDAGYIQEGTFDGLHQQVTELSKIISGLRTSVDKKRKTK